MAIDHFFVVCVDEAGTGDLHVGRVYRAADDAAGARSGFLRVWDESGEDYLHEQLRFVRVTVPDPDRGRLEAVLSAT